MRKRARQIERVREIEREKERGREIERERKMHLANRNKFARISFSSF